MLTRNDQDLNLMSYHADGIADVAIGVMLVVGGLLLTTNLTGLIGVAIILLIPLIFWLKRTITLPRIGPDPVTPLPLSRLRLSRMMLLGVVVFLAFAGFALFATSSWGAAINQTLFNTAIAVFVGVVLVAVAVINRYWRLIAYGFLGMLVVYTSRLVGFDLPVGLIWLGVIIAGFGVTLLAAFVQTHPRLGRPRISG